MKKYAFTFSGQETFSGTITRHSFLLRCMPGTYPFQRSYAHSLTITPYTALTHIADVHGNEMYTGTIDKKHDHFSFTATGFVLCSKYLTHETLDRLYLYPTELTQPSAAMKELLKTTVLPEDLWAKAQVLCSLVSRLLVPSADASHRTAAQALDAGTGSPKDMAHVLLCLCRLSGIGARFVSGLTAGLDHPHCWAEVYCGGVWRALDPMLGTPVEDGYLKIAHGPDYNACAVARGCFRDPDGSVTTERRLTVQVTEHVIRTRDTVPHA
jgi:transglutaminase-like putative cysteine protease